MSNTYYKENFINKVDMEYIFNGQLRDQFIVYIVIEGKYPGGSYETLDSDKKEIIQQAAK